MRAERLAYLGCLEGEFTGGDEEKGLNVGERSVDLVERGNDEGGGLGVSCDHCGEQKGSSPFRYRSLLARGYLFQSGPWGLLVPE
jgi:hypothetical protein